MDKLSRSEAETAVRQCERQRMSAEDAQQMMSAGLKTAGVKMHARSRCRAVCFFFSSRRRHTRLQGDWSSDVCSSDLPARHQVVRDTSVQLQVGQDGLHDPDPAVLATEALQLELLARVLGQQRRGAKRSEERRVGKEWRSRWSPYH